MKLSSFVLSLFVAFVGLSLAGCGSEGGTTQVEPAAEFSYDDDAYASEMEETTAVMQDEE